MGNEAQKYVEVEVQRQDDANSNPYWENSEFRIVQI